MEKRELYTPDPVRGRIIARHIAGQSNREIAIDEKVDRETVRRILIQPKAKLAIIQYQSQLLPQIEDKATLSNLDLKYIIAGRDEVLDEEYYANRIMEFFDANEVFRQSLLLMIRQYNSKLHARSKVSSVEMEELNCLRKQKESLKLVQEMLHKR
jgi:hypothetical protein